LIRTVIKREFLDNLLSFKFIACALVAIVLVTISTVVQAGKYLDRLNDYNKGTALARSGLAKVPAYSFLRLDIYKKPSPLSIFIPGLESQTGNFVTVTHREIPTSLKGGQVNNEFASIFSFFDLSSVIVGVFTILAVLLAYGGISGEKESGTLSLALSNSIPRARFLVGKYLGGFVSLAVATLLCFLVGSIVLLFYKGVDFGGGAFLSLFLIYVFSLLYLSSVLLFGIFVSAVTKSSFQSLVIILAVYLVAVFLLPLAVNSTADGASARVARNSERTVNALVDERSARLERIEKDIPVRRGFTFMRATEEFADALLGRLNPPETLAYFESYIPQEERLREDYALKVFDQKQQDNRARAKIDRLRDWALAFLPASSFAHAAELEAGTGSQAFDRFFSQLVLFWHQYVRYLDEKNALSLKYAYPYPGELTPPEKALIADFERVVEEKKEPWWASPAARDVGKRNAQYEKEIKPLDLSDLPVFLYHKDGFARRLGFWFPNVFILVIENLLLLLLAYVSFVRYDPRTET
jgi:ABC-type transport system involved in multi-copper enzyme maturation permease subunit